MSTQSLIGPAAATRARAAVDVLMPILERLAQATDLPFDPALARRELVAAANGEAGANEERWLEQLARAGSALGLRVTRWQGRLDQSLALAASTAPIVAAPPREGAAPLVLLGGAGGTTHLVGPGPAEDRDETVSAAELATRLGLVGPSAEATFALVHPALPFTGEAVPEAQDHPTPLTRLIDLLRPERSDIGVVLVFAIGIGILQLATPLAVEALVTSIAFGGLAQPVVVITSLLLVCLGFASLLRGLQTWIAELLQRRLFVRLTSELAYRLPRVQPESLDGQHGPELVNRFFEILTVQKVAASLLLDGVAIILSTVIGLVVLAFYHPFLLGYDIILLTLIALIIFVAGRGAVTTSIEESRAKYAIADSLEDLVRHPLLYRLSGGPEVALLRVDSLSRRYLFARGRHFRILFRQIIFALALQAVAGTALLGLGGWLVVVGQLTLGQLVAAELIVSTVVGSFAKLGKHLEGFYDLLTAVEKLSHLSDLSIEHRAGEVAPIPVPLAPTGAGARGDARGLAVKLNNVSYAYEPGHPIFSKFSESLAPGERVALVGPSGAGKSTLAQLLFGLRAPTEGTIELDGIDLRHLRLESARRQIALVGEREVFDGTVAENVHLERPEVSLASVRDSLAKVDLLEKVMSSPGGLALRVSTGGAPFSSGEARRLAIARAIAGEPRLLILDEALDPLDGQQLERVAGALLDRSAPWTLLVITKKPEVAAMCDRRITLATSAEEEDRDA